MIGTTHRLIGRLIERRRLRRRLVRRLRNDGAPVGGISVTDAATVSAHDISLRKHGRVIDVGINFGSVLDNAELAAVLRQRAAAIIDPFSRSRASSAIGDVSDGEASRPGAIAFSSNNPDVILVPDAFFYQTRGYSSFRAASDSWRTGWASREETIVWRGTTTGSGRISSVEMKTNDDTLLQRTRMCLLLRDVSRVDAKFVGLAQSEDPARDRIRLEQAGILAGYVDPMTWLVRKFAIDIDGNTDQADEGKRRHDRGRSQRFA